MSDTRIVTDYPQSKRFIDRTGELHNAWLIKEFSHQVLSNKTNTGNTYWKCLCTDCGVTEKAIPYNNLKSGQSKSCGCSVGRNERREDLVDKQFGHLKVLKLDEELTHKHKQSYWVTYCDICGSVTSKPLEHLTRGRVKSCGSRSCFAFVKAETIAKQKGS